MGQQASKSHAPLTFAYINQNTTQQQQHNEDISIEESSSTDRRFSADFVLANPHLYQLESACHYCSVNAISSSSSSKNVIIADQVNLPCENCKKNKRLSLVRRDLASDLNYIDETYYPNTPHYSHDTLIIEDYLSAIPIPDEEVEEEGWSKLTIGEVTPSTPKRLTTSNSLVVDLSGRSLIKLSSSIGYLINLTKLDLSNNQMVALPRAIGKLKNLRILNASKNQLESLPDTITTLHKLKAINLSHNKLSTLPKGIGHLPSLLIIILSNNRFTEIPREIANLNELMTLNVSNNPLKTIPAEITALKSLKKLLTDNCPFEEDMSFPLQHDPPSLLELCARIIVKRKIHVPSSFAHLSDYFKKEKTCSFCHGPYFDAYVTRGRFIERMGRQIIALDYRLCCAHWSNEEDRLMVLFSNPYQAPHPVMDESVESILSGEEEEEDYFSRPTSLLSSIPQPSTTMNRSSSTSLLRMANTTYQEQELIEEDTTNNRILLPFLNEDEQQSSSSSQRAKYHLPSSSGIKLGFVQLGAKLKNPAGRDRSDTF